MGVLYRANDRRLKRIVALKFLGPRQSDSAEALLRFRREAQAIAALNHPNIATLYEVGEWDGEPFIALEYLPNGTLKDRLKQGLLTLSEVLTYTAQIGAGLEFGHCRGILHRDIKPSNCMFSELDVLKLVDFGLAKSDAADDVTRPGVAVGTLPYMAPEVLRGEEATVRSDIYSLGALVYEMLAGRPLFTAARPESLIHLILAGTAKAVARLPADVPGQVSKAVAKATAGRPQDRFGSTVEFLEALGCDCTAMATGRLGTTRTVSTVHVYPKPTWRRRALVALLAGLLAAGAAIGYRWKAMPSAPSLSTVVVLPFDNLSGNPTDQLLCDGIQEIVTSTLARTSALQKGMLIVPSAEVRRNQVRTISDARKLFGASLAITGAVRKTPESLELTLNLSDASTRRQKDSRILTLRSADTAALQSKLASELGGMLGLGALRAVDSGTPGQTTKNSQAYDLFLQGRGAMENRQLDQAEVLLRKALELDPDFLPARAKLAETYIRKDLATMDPKWLGLADEQVSLAARSGITSDVLWVQAMIRKQTGDTDKAIQLFQELLRRDPNNVESYSLLATALETAGRTHDAARVYQQAINLRPGYWPTYNSLGVFYLNRHDYRSAEQTLLKGLSLAGDNHRLDLNLGATYFQMGRWRDAAKYFERSNAVKPNALAFSNLGTIHFYQGHYDVAAKQFRAATGLQTGNSVNWGNLGDALWQLEGERAHSLEAFETASRLASQQLALNPADWRLRKSQALYLAKLGHTKDALSEISRSLREAPADPSVQLYAARVYAVIGDKRHALTCLKRGRSLGLNPSEIEFDPDFKNLHGDPEYRSLMNQSDRSAAQ